MRKASPIRRILTHYDFEDGSSVEIAATGSIDTPTAVRYASLLLKLKEDELGSTSGKRTTTTSLMKAVG